MFCVFCLIFPRAFAYAGGPRFVAGVFAVFIFISAMSDVGTIGKRLSNKVRWTIPGFTQARVGDAEVAFFFLKALEP